MDLQLFIELRPDDWVKIPNPPWTSLVEIE